MRVQGWSAQRLEGQDIINTSAAIGNLEIPIGAKDPAQATTEVFMASNLDKRLPEIPPGASALDIQRGTWSTTFDIFDSFGNTHTLQVDFTKVVGLVNQWQAQVVVDPAAIVPTNPLVDVGPGGNTGNVFTVDFDNLGSLQSIVDGQGDTQAAGSLQVQVSFDVAGAEAPPGAATQRQSFNLNIGEVGAFRDAITQFAESSSTKIVAQNGNGMGFLDSFRIDQSGVISGVFSNGGNRPLGQLALATFANTAGMEKAGDTTFVVTNNSGDANIGPSGQAGRGTVVSGALEMSNVDLAEQFTDMIITQRGFQANSRTITTSDQMLQELLTLKR
jgi:flagellar hook protein FlgE